jgi:biopolymer transport protein ExbD
MISAQRAQGAETLVFFDDVRYRLDEAASAEVLRAELARAALRPAGRQLLLLADRRVPHGDVVTLVNLARAVGVQRVNVAVKPE